MKHSREQLLFIFIQVSLLSMLYVWEPKAWDFFAHWYNWAKPVSEWIVGAYLFFTAVTVYFDIREALAKWKTRRVIKSALNDLDRIRGDRNERK